MTKRSSELDRRNNILLIVARIDSSFLSGSLAGIAESFSEIAGSFAMQAAQENLSKNPAQNAWPKG